MSSDTRRGFTIIEVLVVVSITALLAGMLLPAIGKARDSARVNTSRSNLRQIGIAHKTYAADWADRHVTLHRDNLGLYGGDVEVYNQQVYGGGGGFGVHPPIVAGWGFTRTGAYVAWAYWTTAPHRPMFQPINFPDGQHSFPGGDGGGGRGTSVVGFGWFRFGCQPKPMMEYLNNRYQDPIHYAPKDELILEPLKPCFVVPGEFVGFPEVCNPAWSSYCLSPAGLYNPAVFSRNPRNGRYWRRPWRMAAGYRVPSFAQVKYPTLKTHMLEHHWLQNPKISCNAAFTGCEPYYFNHSYQSMPVTLFYDGSVRLVSVLEAMSSDRRQARQIGHGLWSRDTPFGEDGYLISDGYDFAATSFHILTTEGIRGRDTLGE
jgi:prepilin-type N-terminal cleavage/methylation domain-containing protein